MKYLWCALFVTVIGLSASLEAAGSYPTGNESESFGRSKGQGRKHRARDRIEDMDTNNDGKISREEATGKVARNFDEADTDNDGYLSFEEIRAQCEAVRERRQ